MNALCDIGSSINLMPYPVFKKLGLVDVIPTRMSLQFADKSTKVPMGIAENILVKVENLIFPVDFVILDMVEDPRMPLILGRPFLYTARAKFDMEDGKLTLSIGDEVVQFDMSKATRQSAKQEQCDLLEECHRIDTVDPLMIHTFQREREAIMSNLGSVKAVTFEEEEAEEWLEYEKDNVEPETVEDTHTEPEPKNLDLNKSFTPKLEPSVKIPPKLELKELPSHLKYAYLDDDETLPVIISSNLNRTQERALLRMLKTHVEAIGWTIADIKGISPATCMHRIYEEEEAKPSRQHQRRLNPHMQEVVRKEIIKLLDAGVIYPISDSRWVSPVQCVPKKGGMQIIKNEKGESVATRPVTGWRVCIDYRKLNLETKKDHYPLPFIDQMLE